MTTELYKVSVTHDRMVITDGTVEWLRYEDSCNTIAHDAESAINDVTGLWMRVLCERGAKARNVHSVAKVITRDVRSEWVP